MIRLPIPFAALVLLLAAPDQVSRYHPPHDYFYLSTDGTLRVTRQIEGGRWSLDVFGPEGRYLGAVDPPLDFGRMRIGHGGG